MTYQLFWRQNTGAYAPEVVLEICGANWQREVVSQDPDEQTDAFRRMSPFGQVLVLILPDGTAIRESVAMVLHLADTWPEAEPCPPPATTDRALLYHWLVFWATNLYETYLRYYHSQNFADGDDAQASVAAKARTNLDKLWHLTDRELPGGDTVLASGFSLADIYLHMLLSWHPDPGAVRSRCPSAARVSTATHTHPVVARIDGGHAMVQNLV